jgi:tRNA A-37 threonylcarbamoyl transferase component Bud32
VRQLESVLRELDRHASYKRTERNAELWKLDFAGQSREIRFVPRAGSLRRSFRASAALNEFHTLVDLQKKGVPVTRASATLVGMNLQGRVGDAVVVDVPPDAVRLGEALREFLFCKELSKVRRSLGSELANVLRSLARAGYSCAGLRADDFVLTQGRILLTRADRLTRGEVLASGLSELYCDLAPFTTRAETLRLWRVLSSGRLPPLRTLLPVWKRRAKQFAEARADEAPEACAGMVQVQDWHGLALLRTPVPLAWSYASRLRFTPADWDVAAAELLGKLERGELELLKDDPSVRVERGRLRVAGTCLEVVVKRPRLRKFRQRLGQMFRWPRTLRIWRKSWMLRVRNIPSEVPLLVLRSRKSPSESLIVLEVVPGDTLATVDLDRFSPGDRSVLFRRAGAILRRVEESGLQHFDAKSTNWIVHEGDFGPSPVLIDVDGIRNNPLHTRGYGVQRLLRAMKLHPQYTPEDSLWLCRGYAPGAIVRES